MWVSKAAAKKAGMTHEGTLYGVAVYLRLLNKNDFDAVPKLWPSIAWLILCDLAYDFAAWFVPLDAELVTPMTVGKEL